jgi:hypothetical protein
MSVDEAISVFTTYSLKEKEEFLAHLMYELTVLMRDNYEVGGDRFTNQQRARRINEIQHRISAFLWSLLRQDPQDQQGDWLVRTILEQPDDSGLERQLREAFARLANQRLTIA